ncbi:MAG: hypothetical protein R3D67_05850 [Hyphomicrobiaceae bacterium]
MAQHETTPDMTERLRRQKARSIAIGLGLGLLVILFYAATIVRLGPNALNKGSTRTVSPAASAVIGDPAACKKAGTCP